MKFKNMVTPAIVILCLWLSYAEEANAQYILVPVVGTSFNEFSPEFAGYCAELDYFERAIVACNNPPPGFECYFVEVPSIVIYPNPDGTFDATASGNVWFQLINVPPTSPTSWPTWYDWQSERSRTWNGKWWLPGLGL